MRSRCFGSQAIIGLPGRIVTLPTRIYALFDYPPEYGLASALSLVFVLITIVALCARVLAARQDAVAADPGGEPDRRAMMTMLIMASAATGSI